MEHWQKTYVKAHLVELIETTACDAKVLASLQSAEILSTSDVDAIKSTSRAFEKSKLLYDILMTRTNGYPVLTKVLHQCKQSAAAKLLLDGYRQHAILSFDVEFQGQVGKLQDIFPETTDQDIQQIFQCGNLIDEELEYFLGGQRTMTLLRQTIPTQQPLYITRFISNRILLNPNIFNENCHDVFVFREVERQKISKLANLNPVMSSEKQLLEITSRFIMLEEDNHWDDIRKIHGCPKHLIRLEEEKDDEQTFILEDSTGVSETLGNFVMKQAAGNKKIYISEDEFVESLDETKARKGVCICDKPGMGKTQLLKSLARKMLIRHPNRIVGFIPLSSFLELPSNPPKMTHSLAINTVLDYLCTSSLSTAILRKIMENANFRLELFFDGLDEVPQENLVWAQSFLRALLEDGDNIRLYVTSRPHVRKELESSLGVIAYDILPFTHQNQIDYLLASWKSKIPNSNENKLSALAESCLENIKNTIKTLESDLMGIPLQCYLLAEVYTKEATLFSNPATNMRIPLIRSVSVYEMYQNFFSMRFPNCERDQSLLNMKHYHTWKALQLLFPQISQVFALHMKVEEISTSATPLGFGVLESAGDFGRETKATKFLHRTFAEFLVAEFFGEVLTGKLEAHEADRTKLGQKVSNFILKTAFHTYAAGYQGIGLDFSCSSLSQKIPHGFTNYAFTNSVIVSFTNSHLKARESPFVPLLVLDALGAAVEGQSLYRTLNSCIHVHHTHLFRFLKDALKVAPSSLIKRYRPYIIQRKLGWLKNMVYLDLEPSSKLLYLAAGTGSLEGLSECFQLFQDCFHFDLKSFLALDNPAGAHIPLHIAVKNGNVEMVEYLANFAHLEGRALLHYCLEDSYTDEDEMASRRFKICEFLLIRDKGLLEEKALNRHVTFTRQHSFEGPLARERIHLNLLKHLIQEGINLKEVSSNNETIVQKALRYMSSNNFLELVRFLLDEGRAPYLFAVEKFDLRHALRIGKNFSIDAFDLIFKIQEIDINYTDRKGDNLLHSALLGNQSVEFVRELISRGANVHYKNFLGHGALHHVMSYYHNVNLEIIQYFVEEGADMEACDIKGNTFVHGAAQDINSSHDQFHELVLYLKSLRALGLLVKNNSEGDTPMHIRLRGRGIKGKTLRLVLEVSGVMVEAVDEDMNPLILTISHGPNQPAAADCEYECMQHLIRPEVFYRGSMVRGEKNILHLIVID